MVDCFDEILEAISNSDIAQYKVIIKLMKDLKSGILDALRIRNCLIFLINLCFEKEYCDYTDRIGKSSKELSGEEKIQMHDLLRVEINS
ncbi:MAG: hypothetical protein ACFFG0_16740 [Candidatus Thorarchaeota archaeon]